MLTDEQKAIVVSLLMFDEAHAGKCYFCTGEVSYLARFDTKYGHPWILLCSDHGEWTTLKSLEMYKL